VCRNLPRGEVPADLCHFSRRVCCLRVFFNIIYYLSRKTRFWSRFGHYPFAARKSAGSSDSRCGFQIFERIRHVICSRFMTHHAHVLIIDSYSLEGLFRLSPSKQDLDKMKAQIDKGLVSISSMLLHISNTDGVANFTGCDAHCVAGVIKSFFRELAEPLMTFDLYDRFVDAMGLPLEECSGHQPRIRYHGP